MNPSDCCLEWWETFFLSTCVHVNCYTLSSILSSPIAIQGVNKMKQEVKVILVEKVEKCGSVIHFNITTLYFYVETLPTCMYPWNCFVQRWGKFTKSLSFCFYNLCRDPYYQRISHLKKESRTVWFTACVMLGTGIFKETISTLAETVLWENFDHRHHPRSLSLEGERRAHFLYSTECCASPNLYHFLYFSSQLRCTLLPSVQVERVKFFWMLFYFLFFLVLSPTQCKNEETTDSVERRKKLTRRRRREPFFWDSLCILYLFLNQRLCCRKGMMLWYTSCVTMITMKQPLIFMPTKKTL